MAITHRHQTAARRAALAIAAAALAGCATTQPTDDYCQEYARREISYAGVTGERLECVSWTFGPTRKQREAFDRRAQP